jgi:DNA replication ATP-dependent helicase Dna2
VFDIPSGIAQREAAYETPFGPVWSVEASELGVEHPGQMLLHRLLDPVDMLSTGAVLGLSSDVDGPRNVTPSFWKRQDDVVWVASRRPPGELLANLEMDRMAWADALDAWRPLAEAVAIGHRRGAVHGMITPWSTWWDAAAGRLAVTDAGCWIGDEIPTDLAWWAPELRFASDSRQPSPAADIWGLTRLLLLLTLPAGEASKADPNLEGVPGYTIPVVARALEHDPTARPQRVAELIAGTSPAPRRTPHPDPHDAGVDVLYGRAHEVERIEHPRFGEGIKFFLTYPDYDEHGVPRGQETTGAFFYEGRGRSVYDSVKHVWEGAEVNLLDAEQITKSTGQRFLTARPDTLPVIEPHWPVTVTNTLKAEGCVSKYFVDLRDNGPSSRPLVFGSLLHGMLDDLARSHGEPPTFEESFDARIPKLRMKMIAAGLGDEDYDRFRQEAREHFNNLAGFAHGRDAEARERVGWTGENVEVTRYSSIYGLQGRIDLVTEDSRAGLHIVELKSGSERDEHVSQVRCYRLLWDGVAERQDMKMFGYLLYSRSGIMRSAPLEDPQRERRILRARNQLVAAQRAIADGESFELPYYLQIPENCHAFCKFRKERCREQTMLLGLGEDATPESAVTASGSPWRGFDPEVVGRAWLYWRHFSRLAELEDWEAGVAIGRILQSGRLRERIASHQAIPDLTLQDVDVASGEITFTGDVPRLFMPGDSVVAHRGDFHGEHILRGRFVRSTPSTLTLRTLGAPNAASLAPNDWIVDSLPARVGHRAAYRALYGFLQRRDDRLLNITLAPKSKAAQRDCSPATEEVTVSPESRNVLNEQQVKAVHWGLTTHGGCLIQGPPGTGKTTVIAHLVRELLDDGQRIIVSAQTNTAVDTVLAALVDVGVRDFLRVGHSARSPQLVSALASAGEDPHEFFSRDVAEATESLDRLARRAAYTSVIGCTTYRAVSGDVIEFLQQSVDEIPFDVAIVDEATQIPEPMTLAPLRLARRFVLVGDHRQLPPIVSNERATTAAVEGYGFEPTGGTAENQLGLFEAPPTASRDPVETPIGLGGLDRSMFERLVAQGLPYVMLEEQYRMNDAIQAFSSRAYYDDRLVAHPSVANSRLELDPEAFATLPERLQSVVDPDSPVVFCDVEGEDRGRTNRAEAEAVVETVRALLDSGAGRDRRSVGIVTPFRAQGQLLRKMLADELGERAEQIDVDTVERYQGSERDTIIVSLVKTDHAGEFLADHRRLNVTLTRARRKLILFGNRECLIMSPLFRDLIEQDETRQLRWDGK